MANVQDIISDEEISKKHWGNFEPYTPREVVNIGVRQYGQGFSTGYTMMQILLAHKLIRRPRPGKYKTTLTEKGKRYFSALPKDTPND